MPKRSYDLSFGSDINKKEKKEKKHKSGEDESDKVVIDMGLGDMGESVTIRDNHIYFYQ